MLTRRQFSTAMAFCIVSAAGCGGKGSTRVSYAPPFSPFGITFSMNQRGGWEVGTGLVTPVGTFAIAQEFARRDDFTYIVLRDRAKGTDQVFKVGVTGYVDIHAVGDHRIRLQQKGNRWIIETDSISGTLDIDVRPSSSAVARVDFGKADPDILVLTNRTLTIEYASVFSSPRTVPLDCLKSITLSKSYPAGQMLSFEWKDGIEHEALAEIYLKDTDNAEANYAALQAAVSKVVDHVQFPRSTSWFRVIVWTVAILAFIIYTNIAEKA